MWSDVYSIVQHFVPHSFGLSGQPVTLGLADTLYFSFTVLTSTGLRDIAPLGAVARTVCTLEQIAGVLVLAIMIARLVSIYPATGAEQTRSATPRMGRGR